MSLAWAHRACQGQHMDSACAPARQPVLTVVSTANHRAWLLWTRSCLFFVYHNGMDGGGVCMQVHNVA